MFHNKKPENVSANGLIPLCIGVIYPLFQHNLPIFCLHLFSESHLNAQVRFSRMINKHTVNYHSSPSWLISRIHPIIILRTPKGCISREYFLNFFHHVYSIIFAEKFQVDRVHIESVPLYKWFQAKISPRYKNDKNSLSSRKKEIALSSETAFSEDNFSWAEGGGWRGLWSWRITKIHEGISYTFW